MYAQSHRQEPGPQPNEIGNGASQSQGALSEEAKDGVEGTMEGLVGPALDTLEKLRLQSSGKMQTRSQRKALRGPRAAGQ